MDDKDTSLISSADTITINSSDVLGSDDLYIDTSSMSSYIYSPTPTYGNITINTAAGANGTWGNTFNTTWASIGANGAAGSSSGLHVTSNATIDGDLTVKGVNITEVLETINKRLAILVPDPAKLEHFAALKKAYEHYKTLEALCEIPKEEPKE